MAKKEKDPPAITTTGDGVNTPELTVEKGKLVSHREAIRDEKEAWQVWRGLKDHQHIRNRINGEIAQRYTGKRPRDPQTLKNEARSWQSNFPTGMLAGIIDRIVPNFLNAIEQQQFLTQATLPEKIDDKEIIDRDKKIEIFREEFTTEIRAWREWRGFNAALITELVLIGYCFAVYTDEDTPYPMFFRQDKAWLHEHSPMFAEYLQVFACEQPILIHELIDLIKDRQEDDGSGWQLENCAEALNKAMPLDPTLSRDRIDQPRTYADIIREASTAQSFMSGAKGIVLAHLFAIEPDKKPGQGRITHWILDSATQKALLIRKRRFDTMSDVVTLFTLEPGNNKFYGSRGVGRMLANLSIGVDELVNDACSQMKMSGMMILKGDSKTGINAQVKIRAPFAFINSDGELQKEQFPTDMEGFVALYEQLTKIAEVAVGAYIPNVLASDPSAGRRTAREASIDYTRELQTASAYIARFVGQYQGEMIHKAQTRLCKKDTTDDTAKAFRERLKDKGLEDNEIDLLAASPAIANIADLTGQEKQQKAALATELAGNPMVDQKKVLEAKIIAQTNPDVAKDWMLTDATDQTIQAEAIRLQLLELKALEGGEPIPVSPRDPHDIHLKVLIPILDTALSGLLQQTQQEPGQIDPQQMDGLHLCLVHGEGHIQMLQQAGAKPDDLKQEIAFFKFMDKVLMQVGQAAQAAALQAQEALQGQHDIALQQHLAGVAPEGAPPAPAGTNGDVSGVEPEVPPDIMAGMPPGTPPHMAKIALSITYKDAPMHIQRQIEKAAGFDVTGLPDENTQKPVITPPPTTVPPAQPSRTQVPTPPASPAGV